MGVPHTSNLRVGPRCSQSLCSEANFRPKSGLPIVMGAVCEEYLVTDIETEPDRADEPFNAPTWIQHGAHIIGPEIVNSARETGEGRGAGIKPEILEPAFHRDEQARRAFGLDLGTK